MDFERVVDEVRDEVGLQRRADAERAVAEFLDVLGERLDASTERVLSEQLPAEMRPVLGGESAVEEFDVEELFARVSGHLQLEEGTAERIARAAAGALGRQLDAGTRDRLRACLPEGIAALFEAEPPADLGALPDVVQERWTSR